MSQRHNPLIIFCCRTLIAKSWSVVSFYLYITAVSFYLSRSRPYTYPFSPFRGITLTSLARPQTFIEICSFKIYSFLSNAWYCLCFHLFAGGREDYKDHARCFRRFELGHLARDCTSVWSSPRNVYRGTGFISGYAYVSNKLSQEKQLYPGSKQWGFEEEVSDILHRYIVRASCLSLS